MCGSCIPSENRHHQIGWKWLFDALQAFTTIMLSHRVVGQRARRNQRHTHSPWWCSNSDCVCVCVCKWERVAHSIIRCKICVLISVWFSPLFRSFAFWIQFGRMSYHRFIFEFPTDDQCIRFGPAHRAHTLATKSSALEGDSLIEYFHSYSRVHHAMCAIQIQTPLPISFIFDWINGQLRSGAEKWTYRHGKTTICHVLLWILISYARAVHHLLVIRLNFSTVPAVAAGTDRPRLLI